MKERIQKIIDYIDNNIQHIDMSKHDIYQRFGFSKSHLNRQFKKYTGKTLNQYLFMRKSELIIGIKNRHPTMSYLDLGGKTNCGSLKTLYKIVNCYGVKGDEIEYFRNRSLLSEILLRMVFLVETPHIEFDETICHIFHNVKDTELQLYSFFPLDNQHYYKIFFDPEELDLSFTPMGVELIEDDTHLHVPGTIVPYVNLLFNFHERHKKELPFSLINAIRHWRSIVAKKDKVIIAGEPFYLINVKSEKIRDLSINRESPFILYTNSFLENIRATLFENCKKKIFEQYHVSFETSREYIDAVKEQDYGKMKTLLDKITNLHRKETISLFIEFIEEPCWDDYLLHKIPYKEVPENLSREELIDLILEFKKTCDLLPKKNKWRFDEWISNRI